MSMWKIKSTENTSKNHFIYIYIYIYISSRHMMISESVCKATDLMVKRDFMSKEMSQDV